MQHRYFKIIPKCNNLLTLLWLKKNKHKHSYLIVSWFWEVQNRTKTYSHGPEISVSLFVTADQGCDMQTSHICCITQARTKSDTWKAIQQVQFLPKQWPHLCSSSRPAITTQSSNLAGLIWRQTSKFLLLCFWCTAHIRTVYMESLRTS